MPRWAPAILAFLVTVVVGFVPVLLLLAETRLNDSSDLPGPILVCSSVFVVVVSGSLAAWLVHRKFSKDGSTIEA